jgi:hypothetical protein
LVTVNAGETSVPVPALLPLKLFAQALPMNPVTAGLSPGHEPPKTGPVPNAVPVVVHPDG